VLPGGTRLPKVVRIALAGTLGSTLSKSAHRANPLKESSTKAEEITQVTGLGYQLRRVSLKSERLPDVVGDRRLKDWPSRNRVKLGDWRLN